MTFYEVLQESFNNVTINQLALRGFFAFAIIILGIAFGKLVDLVFRKIIRKVEINKHIRNSFIELFLLVIRWTIYITFINFGLNQLEIPVISDFFSSILITIPAFTGALLLLVIGVGLAYYLRKIIKNSEAKEGEIIADILFYFVIFVFGIYAIWLALLPLNSTTTHSIIIVLVAISAAGVIFYNTKKELKKHNY